MNKVLLVLLSASFILASCCKGLHIKYSAKELRLQTYPSDADAAKQETVNITVQSVENARKVGAGSCVDPDEGKIYEEKITRADVALTLDKPLVLDSVKNIVIPAGTNLLENPKNYTVTLDDSEGSIENGTITIQMGAATKRGSYVFTISGKTSKGESFMNTASLRIK